MNSTELRSAFTGYFANRGHHVVPSASLIPHDPSVLFTIAGMVPFKPYFLGEEPVPWPRATSVQKCFRTVDIDIVGTTERHCTFFEMLGNFSFGDYFKEEAIPMAWELVTDVLGIEAERLFVTVHESDAEAAEIWADAVGVRAERIQRMGADNFWQMGETGPCGPSSEIYFDRGEALGEGGGPSKGDPERYVEIWNLVFMQFNRRADGSMEDLPRRNIDTGAGLERILPIVQGTGSLFATDVMAPLVQRVESMSGRTYGRDEKDDVSIRVLADHGRAMAMLVADGVVPSNEGRGYVLRRVVRRAVLRAQRLGISKHVTPSLVETTARVLGDTYVELARQVGYVSETLEREEDRFRRTLETGSSMLEDVLSKLPAAGPSPVVVPGDVAFVLHDTHGFPIELTLEVAREHGAEVDLAGFEAEMARQRERARSSARELRPTGEQEAALQVLLEEHGPTPFLGYDTYELAARVVGVFHADANSEHVILDRTPFYPEGGGQVGDTGTIATETGRATVLDTKRSAGGLIVHVCQVEGELYAGQEALAVIDAARREATRRNHTSTHLLHSALRQVVGDHVRQQGSLVAPDRLRFDFSSPHALSSGELAEVEAAANEAVIADEPVRIFETTRSEAEAMGALAFFGDKYGEVVRVVEAGHTSRELCGGTHVERLGMIGPITIVSESSIGSGTRRIEALSGTGALALAGETRRALSEAARLLNVEPTAVPAALEKLLERQREMEREARQAASKDVEGRAREIVALARERGSAVAVLRRDGLEPEVLRRMAQMAQELGGLVAVVLAGSPDGEKFSLAVATDGTRDAAELAKRIATRGGGGGGGSPRLALAGGRGKEALDAMLELAREALDGTGTP